MADRLRHFGREPSESAIAAALASVAQGRSLARATGVAFFRDAVLEVRGVLCPRADSECVAEAAIARTSSSSRVADLGCGSGALLIAVLQSVSGASGVAVDDSERAVAATRRNLARNGVHAETILASWHAPCSRPGDVVIWNPPYVKSRLCGEIDDPREALDGGEDGLECYRHAPWHWVAEGGVLVAEVGAGQKERVVQMIGGKLLETRRDVQGIERALVFSRD